MRLEVFQQSIQKPTAQEATQAAGRVESSKNLWSFEIVADSQPVSNISWASIRNRTSNDTDFVLKNWLVSFSFFNIQILQLIL